MKKILKAFAQGLFAAFIGGILCVFIVAIMCFVAWEMPDTLLRESWLFRMLIFPAVVIAGGVAYSLTDKYLKYGRREDKISWKGRIVKFFSISCHPAGKEL